jgi:hypothetical protein
MNRKVVHRILVPLLGAAAGFGYYWFIGCQTGTCPITGSPYVSTAYGALIGLVLTTGSNRESKR